MHVLLFLKKSFEIGQLFSLSKNIFRLEILVNLPSLRISGGLAQYACCPISKVYYIQSNCTQHWPSSFYGSDIDHQHLYQSPDSVVILPLLIALNIFVFRSQAAFLADLLDAVSNLLLSQNKSFV
ncbi:hypothetical protein Tco_0535310 [Tanacetum coccineum]